MEDYSIAMYKPCGT